MAISVVGYAQAVVDGGPITCNKPTGTLTGDTMIAFGFADWALHADLYAPTGWTLFTQADNGSNKTHHKVWYKTAFSSEVADYTFGGAGSAANCIAIVTLRGVNPVPSNWFYDCVLQNTSSLSRTAPSLTGAGDFLLCCVGTRINGAAPDLNYVAPSGMAKIAEMRDSAPYSAMAVAYLGGTPPNPTTTRTFTLQEAVAYNGAGSSILFPAASGPVPVNAGVYVHNGTNWVSTTGGVAV